MPPTLAPLALSTAGFSAVGSAHAGVEQRRSCDLRYYSLRQSEGKPVGCGKDVTRRRALPVLFAILTLGACASTPTQPLKESDRAAISTVEVSPEVKVRRRRLGRLRGDRACTKWARGGRPGRGHLLWNSRAGRQVALEAGVDAPDV